jgi:hypothetical protein
MYIQIKIIDYLKDEYDYTRFIEDLEYRNEIYKNFDVDENNCEKLYQLLNEYDEQIMHLENVDIPESFVFENLEYKIIINDTEDAFKNISSCLKYLHNNSDDLKFPIMFELKTDDIING